MKFYLGTNKAAWLGYTDAPLFVSHRTLRHRRTLPQARGTWSLDSGGFTELSTYGEWRTTPTEYIQAIRRYRDEIGGLDWAAPQDWMCEPWITEKTGKTVAEHQELTINNYITLRALDSDLPLIPVLQGWKKDDYERHLDRYAARGIDLIKEPTVGLGSVCRRQATNEIHEITLSLYQKGLALHGFGVKTQGISQYAGYLQSADSMAWSLGARIRKERMNGCTHRAKTCADCLTYAQQWAANIRRKADERPRTLWEFAP